MILLIREFRLSHISLWPSVFLIWRVYVNSCGPDKTFLFSAKGLISFTITYRFRLQQLCCKLLSALSAQPVDILDKDYMTSTFLIATSVCCPSLSPTNTAVQLEPRTFLEGKAVGSQICLLLTPVYEVDPVSGLRMPELNQNEDQLLYIFARRA